MPDQIRIVRPGPIPRSVLTADGKQLIAPADWILLPPGDAGLTRRVKAAGPTWTVQEKRGRKTFSQGVWAPADRVAAIRAELEAERATPAYAKKRAADANRREVKQAEYVGSFQQSVFDFLRFAPRYAELAEEVSRAIALHATPVGSGTVARTERIPIEQRAEAAVIAWLRHNTTNYDNMKIARIKGERRQVRRMLAEKSRNLLAVYRAGSVVNPGECLLRLALSGTVQGQSAPDLEDDEEDEDEIDDFWTDEE